MKNLYFKFAIVVKLLITSPSIIYSQFIDYNHIKQNVDVELVLIKSGKFKETLESIVKDSNYCKEKNLVWYLDEKEGVMSLSLLIENSISKDKLSYIAVINNYVVYLSKIDDDKELIKTSLKFNYIDHEYIIFQDFSYWILVKEGNEYIVKREVKNCG